MSYQSPPLSQCNALIIPQAREEQWLSCNTKSYDRARKEFQRFRAQQPNSTEQKNKKLAYIRKKNNKKKNKTNIVPHAGEDTDNTSVLSRITDLLRVMDDFSLKNNQMISVGENLGIFMYQLWNCNTLSDIVMATLGYIKMNTQSCLVVSLTSLLDNMFSPSFDDADPVPQSDVGVVLNTSITSLRDYWQMFKTNPVFSHISYLITVAMTSTYFKCEKWDFDLAGVNIISLEARKEQIKADDFFDAIVNTLEWVIRTGASCIKERSLAPILYSDLRLKEYTELVHLCLLQKDNIVSGQVTDMDKLAADVEQAIKMTEEYQRITTNPYGREVISKKFLALSTLRQDIQAHYDSSLYRMAPFGVSINGESSIGKSDLAENTMKVALAAMGFTDPKQRIISLNDSDRYDSEYTADVVGVHIDDAANTNSAFVETAPTGKYIKYFNNVAVHALKADVGSKGKVGINFKCGVITTNVPDLRATTYSNHPVSILRRFIHVTPKVKPQYATGAALNTDHPDILNATPGHQVDAWTFKVYEHRPDGIELSCGTTHPVVYYDDVLNKEVKCENISLEQYYRCIVYLAKIHKKKQDNQVQRNAIMHKSTCCMKCHQLPQFCKCVPEKLQEYDTVDEKDSLNILKTIGSGFNTVRDTMDTLFEKPLDSITEQYVNDTISLKIEEENKIDKYTWWLAKFYVNTKAPFNQSVFDRSLYVYKVNYNTLKERIILLSSPDAHQHKLSFDGNYEPPVVTKPKLNPSLASKIVSPRDYADFRDNYQALYVQLTQKVGGMKAREMLRNVESDYRKRHPNWKHILEHPDDDDVKPESLSSIFEVCVGKTLVNYLSSLLCTWIYTKVMSLPQYYKRQACDLAILSDYSMLASILLKFPRFARMVQNQNESKILAMRDFVWCIIVPLVLILILILFSFHMVALPLIILLNMIFLTILFQWCVCYKIHCVRCELERIKFEGEEYFNILRRVTPQYATKALAGTAATVIMIVVILRQWKSTFIPQSTEYEEIEKGGSWFGSMMPRMWCSGVKSDVAQSTPEHLLNAVKKNICIGKFQGEGFKHCCNIFFPRKSVMLFPEHVLYPKADMNDWRAKTMEIEIHRAVQAGGVFKVRINTELCYFFPNSDLVMAYVPVCPDFANLTKWFPQNKPVGKALAQLVIRQKTLDFETELVEASFRQVSHTYRTMFGASYNTKLAQTGACMGLVLSNTTSPSIVGFHIGGDSNKGIGISVNVTQSSLSDAYTFIATFDNLSAHASTIPEKTYGIQTLVSNVPHSKAEFVRSMNDENFVEIIGSTAVRAEQRSCIKASILSDAIFDVCGQENIWGPPKLKPNWRAFNTNIEYFTKPSDCFDPLLLHRAVGDYLAPLLNKIPAYSRYNGNFSPMSLEDNLNGIDGVKFLDSIKKNTGSGFPIFGKKLKHFDTYNSEDGRELVIPKDYVLEEVARIEQCYRDNVRAYPVTVATLKDESTPVDSEKVRVFQAAPLALSILIRKYFLPLSRFLCFHSHLSECAVGINCAGPQWDKLMNYITNKNEDGYEQMVAFDYSKYDVRMSSQVTRKVWDAMISLCSMANYNTTDLQIMRAMVVDICHPLIDINGTMLQAYAMNTSGNNMTVFVNSIAGSIYMRMGFFNRYPKAENFRDAISLITYGDDALCSVSAGYRDFNFITYKQFLAEYGMKITLPDKSEREVATLPLEECDFLKRKSNFIPEIEGSLGCLDELSIFKGLHSSMKSSAVSPEEQAISCIESAMHEWFAHGREKYELRRTQMQEVCDRIKLPASILDRTFDERVQFYRETYKLDENLISTFPIENFSRLIERSMSPAQRGTPDSEEASEYDEGIIPQSGTAADMADGETAPTHEHVANVGFHDAALGGHDHRGVPEDIMQRAQEDPSVSMDEFFRRPIRIDQRNWTPITFLDFSINPWDLYFSHPSVINRIATYKNLKATLKVKITINANPMDFGRLMYHYQPLHLRDQSLFQVNALSQNLETIQSQRMKVFVDPSKNAGGELTLPFVFYKTFVDIPSQEWQDLGLLHCSTLSTLYSATKGTYPATISVYAWAEDVVLSGLTRYLPIDIVPQSDSECNIVPQSRSEYQGIISKPMSIVSKIAGILSEVPLLSNFAMATELGAASIAKMASLFGFSRPPEVVASFYQPATVAGFAHGDGRVNLLKLTVDSQQELTVDPCVIGIQGHDEMTVQSIACRESILAIRNWCPPDPPGSIIFTCVVDPFIVPQNNGSSLGPNQMAYFLPACAVAAAPFEYWRGSMKYRFQVVCNALHRGRIRAVYDPCGGASGPTIKARPSTYTTIIDLAETSDFTLQVGWGQTDAWRRHLDVNQPVNYSFSGPFLSTDRPEIIVNSENYGRIGNGTLTLYVENRLSNFQPGSDYLSCDVIVHVSCAEDIEFAKPTSYYIQQMVPYISANGAVQQFPVIDLNSGGPPLGPPDQVLTAARQPDLKDVVEAIAPLSIEGQFDDADEDIVPQSDIDLEPERDSPPQNKEELAIMGLPPINTSVVNKLYMGEVIVSFRSLLKRFMLHEVLTNRNSGAVVDNSFGQGVQSTWEHVRRIYPFHYNQSPGMPAFTAGRNLTTNGSGGLTGPLQPAVVTLMNFLMPCYVAVRGGVRIHLDAAGLMKDAAPMRVTVGHHMALRTIGEFDGFPSPGNVDPLASANHIAANWYAIRQMPKTGVAYTLTSVNPAVTVEVPYQNHTLFSTPKSLNPGGFDETQNSYEIHCTSRTNYSDRLTSSVLKYVAAAEDFSLMFYTGPPVLFTPAYLSIGV
jgi:hypothetical protein